MRLLKNIIILTALVFAAYHYDSRGFDVTEKVTVVECKVIVDLVICEK